MIRFFALVVFCFAAAAWADKPRISVVEFKGPQASKVKQQIAAKLCKTFKCVKPGGDGEDVAVSAVVTGEVEKKGKVTVSVYFDEDQEPITREVKLKAGKLPPAGVKSVTSAVKEAVASGTSPDDAASAALAGSP